MRNSKTPMDRRTAIFTFPAGDSQEIEMDEQEGIGVTLRSTILYSVKGGTGARRRWYTAAAACLLLGAGLAYAQTQKAVPKPPGTLTFRLALKRIEPASVTVPAGPYQVVCSSMGSW